MASPDDEPSLEELFEDAPCGHVATRPDGAIVRVNRTFLGLTGYRPGELRGRSFTSLLTGPGALLFETYCAPLLRLRGSIGEVALDLVGRPGPVPVLLSAALRPGGGWRVAVLSAPTRREYERELKEARAQAEAAGAELRRRRELAERELAEQRVLLAAVARLAAGDRDTPIEVPQASSQAALAAGLERMRRDVQHQFQALLERNAEVVQLNADLRHQIEQRSLLMIESMEAGRDAAAASGTSLRLGEAPSVLRAGTLLAQRYRVLGTLGQGAMGIVHEVERLSDGRRLAAKVLASRPDLHALVRFAREARMLARLRHPNLVAIVDVDVTVDRVAYIVMELARGRSLADCRDRHGDPAFVLPVLRQVAEALTAVHAAAVIHRDLKPTNVLIREDADAGLQVKLVDFGVSRLLEGPAGADEPAPTPEAARGHGDLLVGASGFTDAATVSPWPTPTGSFDSSSGDGRGPARELTQIGAILGTPRYMAPELLLGARLALPPSDVFSFGVMAYEVLTRSVPFDEPPPLLAAGGPGRLVFVPLAARCPALAPRLARTLDRCLAEDPKLRPTAAELVEALR